MKPLVSFGFSHCCDALRAGSIKKLYIEINIVQKTPRSHSVLLHSHLTGHDMFCLLAANAFVEANNLQSFKQLFSTYHMKIMH